MSKFWRTLIGLNTVSWLGDGKLTWHFHYWCLTIKRRDYLLWKMDNICNTQTKQSVHLAWIHSILILDQHVTLIRILKSSKKCDEVNTISQMVKEIFPKSGIHTVFSLYICKIILILKINSDSPFTLGKAHHKNASHQNWFSFQMHKKILLMRELNTSMTHRRK